MPLTPDDQVKYKALYIQTAKPYVKDIQDSITSFLQGVVDPQKLDTGHRAAHSMGSQSAMMGYMQISDFSRALEGIFRAKAENQLNFTPEILTKMDEGAKTLTSAVESIENGSPEPDLSSQRVALLTVANLPTQV